MVRLIIVHHSHNLIRSVPGSPSPLNSPTSGAPNGGSPMMLRKRTIAGIPQSKSSPRSEWHVDRHLLNDVGSIKVEYTLEEETMLDQLSRTTHCN